MPPQDESASPGRHVSPVRHRHPLARRVLVVGAAFLGIVLVAAAVAFWRLEGNISAVDISALLGNNRPESSATADPRTNLPPLNMLLMGSDTRTELEDASEFGGTEDPALQGARSDTTLLVHLSADRQSATVVSIPRDSMVPIPDCDDPDATLEDAIVRQFNFAFRDGGPGCTVKAVEANTGIFLDHYAVVNFEGFQAMVDGLGGVDVCLPEAVQDQAAGLDLPAGVTHVDGRTALAYVRARKEFGDGSDIGRIGRQQAFLSSVVQEATSTGLLLRPDRLLRFLDAATKSLTTDPQLASIGALSDLALQVRGMEPDQVRFVTVPIEDYPADPNRVQWADGAEELWEALRGDAPLPGTEPAPSATAAPKEPLTVSPAEISVRVVNSSGVAGMARAAAEDLGVQGFVVTGTANGEAGVVSGVVVRHPVDAAEAARTLAAAFPGAVLEPDAGLSSSFEVELGTGAQGVVEVENRLPGPELPDRPEPAGPTEGLDTRAASEDICG